jgi:hypothetical protein
MVTENASTSSGPGAHHAEASDSEKENRPPGSKRRDVSDTGGNRKDKRVKSDPSQGILSRPSSTAAKPENASDEMPVDFWHPQHLLEDDPDEPDECPHEDYCERIDINEEHRIKAVLEEQLRSSSYSSSDKERYQAAGIELERVEEYQEKFDYRMKSVIDFLFDKAQNTEWKDLATQKSWIARSTFHQFKNSSSDAVFHLFRKVIPGSTRAILGKEPLTKEQFSALPSMTCSEKGVYLCYVSEHSLGDGIYSGSSTDACDNRESQHNFQILRAQEVNTAEVKGTFYKYMAECPASKANFRLVAKFSNNEGFDAAGFSWLVRLLETVMMMMFDTFDAQKAHPANELKRLNAALSTKQQIKSHDMRKCSNCPRTSEVVEKVRWYYDWNNDLATNFLCDPCWRYKKRTGKDRPKELWENLRAHPESAQCSNPECGVELTGSTMQWHPDKSDRRIVCKPCYTWACSHNGEDRPKEIITRTAAERTCVDCKTTSETAWRWHQVESGGYRCNSCHTKLNNPQQDAANARVETSKVCADCGTVNPTVWKPPCSR